MEPWETLPGETLIDDVSELKLKDISTRKELAVVEAENVRIAVVKYLASRPSRRLAPFDLSWSLKLHREMFGDVWKWAGEIRQVDLNFGLPWHQVQVELQKLFEDLAYWEREWPDVLEQATHLHHRSVQIHPFRNGNGRWSRMLANIWLKQHDSPIIVWPEETIGRVSTIRDEYLNAVREADGGRMKSLLDLHRRFLDAQI